MKNHDGISWPVCVCVCDEWSELIWGPLLWQISLCLLVSMKIYIYLKRIFKLTHWVAMIIACCPFKFNFRRWLRGTKEGGRRRGQSVEIVMREIHQNNHHHLLSAVIFLIKSKLLLLLLWDLIFAFYLSILISFSRPFAHPMSLCISQNAIVIVQTRDERKRRKKLLILNNNNLMFRCIFNNWLIHPWVSIVSLSLSRLISSFNIIINDLIT